MYVLHGSWRLPRPEDKVSSFILWAETTTRQGDARKQRAGTTARRAPASHPFAMSARELQRAWHELSTEFAPQTAFKESTAVLLLPTRHPRGRGSSAPAPQPSTPLLQQANETMAPAKPSLLPWRVDALSIVPHDVLALLANLPSEEEAVPGVRVGADLRYWGWVGEFVLELLSRQRFRPVLLKQGERYLARWQPLLDEPHEQERLTRLARAMPPLCRAFIGHDKNERRGAVTPRELLEDFVATTVDGFARGHADFGRDIPPQTLADQWLRALGDRNPVLQESSASINAFYEQYRAWAGLADASQRSPSEGGDAFRLCFRLDPPSVGDSDKIIAPKPRAQNWKLRYLLQANDDPSLLIPAERVWHERGSALKFLNRKLDAPQERLLAGLGMASKIFPPLETSLSAARPEECTLNVEQAYAFIRETALLLQASGFGVLVPGVSGKLGVRVKLSTNRQSPQQKGGVAGLTFDSLIQFNWQLTLNGEPLSPEEFERLATLKVPLVQVRGQWVELRPDQIERAIGFWRTRGRGESGAMSVPEALRLALSQEPGSAGAGLPITQVSVEGWMADLLQKLGRGDQIRPLRAPDAFRGTLRHYQSSGLSWLAFLRQWRLGACLADDMGLGKTVEVTALLLHERETHNGNRKPALVICPTSVVSNWQHELSRFAPDLRVLVHHGAARNKAALAEQAARHDVVLSSYALLHRDVEQLAAVNWGDVILDEAQNIKNPATKQAQAARQIAGRAEWRAALTGTPVENRLTELWSLFQFLNPDYLGSQKDFFERFAKPIERTNDADATQRLKALVGPFILRRVKTDPHVIGDLPQKNEMKVFCNLTKEQATLYEAVVRDSLQRIAQSEGIERRGIVLATLMKLKQVCNHPAQFLSDGSSLKGRSGKLARLTEMLEEVRAVHDRALVFTQFAEMGTLLQTYLQEYFGEQVLFLYGGTPAKARTLMIERFQQDPNGPLVFILSIKAGGTGLNLMRANHVFHFDRWWNPAVENQATDRAFRIGQTKNVAVYKFLVAGTFEDKIDEMIERKKALAENIVGSSEAWITELSTEQLRDLLVLRREAIADE